MTIFKKLRSVLGIKSPAQKIYTHDVLPEPIGGLAKYPPKKFAGQEGIYAYRVWFMVADASSLVACIRDNFPTVSGELFQQGPHRANNGESLDFAIYPEFSGAAVRMLTNSPQLLHAIDALQLQPPPPWFVFPHVDASTLGSMQGALDFWWKIYWDPFWETASPSEHEEYMRLHNVPPAWDERFKFLESIRRQHEVAQ